MGMGSETTSSSKLSFRGGSCYFSGNTSSVSYRNNNLSSFTDVYLGFRIRLYLK